VRIDAFCGKGGIEMTEVMEWLEEHIPDYEEIVDDAIHKELYSTQFLNEMLLGREQSTYLRSESDGEFVYLEAVDEPSVERITVEGGKPYRVEAPLASHVERIEQTWFDDRKYHRIKRSLRDAGRGFAQKVNRSVMLVLRQAASVQEAQSMSTLIALISEVADGFSDNDLMADTLVIHRSSRTTLLHHDIVVFEPENGKRHFVGHTKTGLNVFWSDELDKDSFLILDSTSIGCMIESELQIEAFKKPGGYNLHVTEYVNPVVQNRQSVRLIKNIMPLIRRLKGTYQMELIGQCFFTDEPCSKVKGTSDTCFVAVPSKGFEDKLEIIEKILTDKRIDFYVALLNVEPSKNAFCTKICGKIIESRFCIVFLDKDLSGCLNANVFYEYGMMSSLRKPIIPLQREGDPLPFNVQYLDVVKYSNDDFREKVLRAIEMKIEETERV
jgi:hypothetical protein